MNIVSLEEIPPPPYSTPLDRPSFLYGTLQKMEMLCRSAGGVGLAAAQVGLPWNAFVCWSNWPEENPMSFGYFVDCEYSSTGDRKSPSVEGCLSLPGLRFMLDRFESVHVSGKRVFSLDGKIVVEDYDEFLHGVSAVIFQHEIDHQSGRDKMLDKIGNQIHIS